MVSGRTSPAENIMKNNHRGRPLSSQRYLACAPTTGRSSQKYATVGRPARSGPGDRWPRRARARARRGAHARHESLQAPSSASRASDRARGIVSPARAVSSSSRSSAASRSTSVCRFAPRPRGALHRVRAQSDTVRRRSSNRRRACRSPRRRRRRGARSMWAGSDGPRRTTSCPAVGGSRSPSVSVEPVARRHSSNVSSTSASQKSIRTGRRRGPFGVVAARSIDRFRGATLSGTPCAAHAETRSNDGPTIRIRCPSFFRQR